MFTMHQTLKNTMLYFFFALSFFCNLFSTGIATEAGQAVIEYGFNTLGFNRIQATFDPRNVASRRVLEKLGFQNEGFLREYYYLRDEFCDRIMLSLLKKDYIASCL